MTGIENTVRTVVALLVDKQYNTIVEKSFHKRVTADEIQYEIDDYPGVISNPPDSAYNNLLMFPVEGSDSVLVDFYLWFDNNQSELMVVIEIFTNDTGVFSFWDILVP